MSETTKSRLKIIKKDLFDHLTDKGPFLAHGVNCMGAMGAGIALDFKKKWPELYEDYRATCKEGKLILGAMHTWSQIQPAYDKNGRVYEKTDVKVYNLAIKSHWRNPASYLAIESSVNLMLDDMSDNHNGVVAMPWIGCGLGGLDKTHVAKILRRCLSKERKYGKYQEIWVYEGKPRQAW